MSAAEGKCEKKKGEGEGGGEGREEGREERSKDPPFIGFKSAWQFLAAGWLCWMGFVITPPAAG